MLALVTCAIVAAPVTGARAEPREPGDDGSALDVGGPGTESHETGSPDTAASDGLPEVVGELLDLRLDAQAAITEAEIARADAERARVHARAAGFTATVARLRARHARAVLERWAADLYRNEVGIQAYVDLAETGLLQPERTLDVAHWLGAAGRKRERAIENAAQLVKQAEELERIALESLAAAEQAEQYAATRRAEADVILESTETALRAAVGDDFRHQLTVGPDGCPTDAPDGSIRSGSPEDVARLCARSVALAPTPEAALAIKYAFRTLGASYACDGIGRNLPMRYDCSSLVARAYAEGAGLLTATETWIPTTRNLLPWDGASQVAWARTIESEEALPGDLVLYDTEHLASRHVVMLLADGQMLHVAECGDISHVTGFWGYADGTGYHYLGVRRVDPAIARDPTFIPGEGDPWLNDGVHTDPETPPVGDEHTSRTGTIDGTATTSGTIPAPEPTAEPGKRTGPETGSWGADRAEAAHSRDREAERMTRRYDERSTTR